MNATTANLREFRNTTHAKCDVYATSFSSDDCCLRLQKVSQCLAGVDDGDDDDDGDGDGGDDDDGDDDDNDDDENDDDHADIYIE